jgi:hypothetical protein
MENYGTELTTDRYSESIELSNKCREFYLKRMEDAEARKQTPKTTPSPRGGKTTSIDVAMGKLREEMVSKKQLVIIVMSVHNINF